MFNPGEDLKKVQALISADSTILSLMGLTDGSDVEIAERIIKKSQWNDIVDGKRICIYFLPSRGLRNLKFKSEAIEIDCHVPSAEYYIAYEIQERIYSILNEVKINKRQTYFDGQLGELPTISGFFCCGSRYIFNRKI